VDVFFAVASGGGEKFSVWTVDLDFNALYRVAAAVCDQASKARVTLKYVQVLDGLLIAARQKPKPLILND